MIRALNTAASGMEAQQQQIDIIANNLANVNTAGFKKARGQFQDLFYQQLREAQVSGGDGTSAPVGLEVGQGVRLVASQKMFTSGAVIKTDNDLDLAIMGNGFFKLRAPDGGSTYTRDGRFKLTDGKVTSMNGYELDPGMEIPAEMSTVVITAEGMVKGKRPNDESFTELGQLNIVNFQNPAGLQSIGANMFRANEAAGQPMEGQPGHEGLGKLEQGSFEGSNVQVVEEMIDLISAQRAYEMNSKVIQATDQMLREANNLR